MMYMLVSWLKEFERFYYLCTFFDYNKNVYGLDSSQQPPIAGAYGSSAWEAGVNALRASRCAAAPQTAGSQAPGGRRASAAGWHLDYCSLFTQ